MNESAVELADVFDSRIIRLIDPALWYPQWTSKQIKRKYGKYPAVYLDIYYPVEPTLYSMLPLKAHSWKRR